MNKAYMKMMGFKEHKSERNVERMKLRIEAISINTNPDGKLTPGCFLYNVKEIKVIRLRDEKEIKIPHKSFADTKSYHKVSDDVKNYIREIFPMTRHSVFFLSHAGRDSYIKEYTFEIDLNIVAQL